MRYVLSLLLVLLLSSYSWAASAVLSWDPPTINVDGTVYNDGAGFKVYWGTASRTYTKKVDVPGKDVKTYTATQLGVGTWYFAVTAYDTSGNESDYSNEVTKTITQGMVDIPKAPAMNSTIIIIVP
jgi:fibronectin type 3 domain-containing protein